MSKYRVGDIIEKMDGNIAKIHNIYLNGNYVVGCQGKYWNLREDQIKSLAARRPEPEPEITRFEIMDL